MAQDWKTVLENARAELAELEIKREAIDTRIVQIKRTIQATEPLANDDHRLRGLGSGATLAVFQAMGITDACREVLRSAQTALAPLEVRAAIVAGGIDLSGQSNAMASIHAVLKRLHEQDQVRIVTSKDGGTLYRWRRVHFPRKRGVPLASLMRARPAPTPVAPKVEPIPAPPPVRLKPK
jgi:hypothetical protein